MTKEEFALALERLYPFTDYLYFHLLGEPLCHPMLEDFVRMASESGFKVAITTNGTLLSDKIAALPLYKVSVSLHSFEEGSDEDREAYLESVCRFARMAAKRGTLISLRLWNEGSGADNSFTEDYLRRAFPSEWRKGRSACYTLESGIYLEYAKRFTWPDMGEEEREVSFCYGLRDQIGVLVDGRVVPCCLDAEGDITLGNIFDTTLGEIIESERAKALLRGFDLRHATEELCQRCNYAERF